MKNLLILICCSLLVLGCKTEPKHSDDGHHSEEPRTINGENYSPYVGEFKAEPLPKNYDKPLWGDTHLHTSYSTDAGMIGNRLGPEEAYRVAKGEEVVASHGFPIKLIRPLDFLVISDHAENLGLAPMISESDPILMKYPFGKALHDLVKEGKGHDAFQKWVATVAMNTDSIDSPEMMETAWKRELNFADQYNEPGVFTAMIGFEWTSIATRETPGNLHRVVVFKDDADKASKVLPFSAFDSVDPEDLWNYMDEYEKNTGGSILAIAHNGNLSNGVMFPEEKRLNGMPIDKNYVETRARLEPLYEVTQIKGDGEAHPFMSPNDEFSNYGNWDKSDIAGLNPKEDWMLPMEYARSALQIGLQLEEKLGTNPYKFGMIGSTDAHTSLATTREENFFGKASHLEPEADRWEHVLIGSLSGDDSLSSYSYETIGAGLAAVWARENTREGIYDAMQNKETYATTGTRIIVRMFGGWDFTNDDLSSKDYIEKGYSKGVPMGGDISNAPDGKAPIFLVKTSKDVDGANLDRLQMIKGWIDSEGKRQERIYDLAVSDGRKIGEDGRCKTPVGNTVNIENASYTNSIGSTQFETLWTDPDFDSNLRAFYYVRVLEIPTPTWQAFDAKRFSTDMPDTVEMMAQERAYTSPIWYTPK
ncbi:DUF3604 domain-containing protein [Urechidicola vernalis]|uniref:DUF3604 domain-containing protein n=1 Tax=Urechidicola vernalis TaxID=3075600 RepID=A0ABU2Y5K2_9FLAO|nr:DUF3604 domain-containing protein [Urechidicola sp. P050]MDT0553460.1 DUF3604 domain-containing protein [Urechidicola sp. P050]